jgi:fatty acid desaturase
MKSIFKYSWKDTFLILQAVLAIAVAFSMAVIDPAIGWLIIIAPFHIMLIVCIQNSSLHHHTHWPTFNRKFLNQAYELLLAGSSGVSPQTYRISHSIHHKYVNDLPTNGPSRDRISVFGHGVDGQVENVWKFCYRIARQNFIGPWKYVLYQMWQHTQPKTPMMNFVLWRREQFVIVGFFLAVMLINFIYGLWLLFVIYSLAHFLNYSWHYGEHYGAYHYRGDTTQDSVGIYNQWYNVICFNAGYHQEHHHRPGVHWTQQPEITKLLPSTRITTNGMHITNVPWLAHLKLFFKSWFRISENLHK